MRLTQVTFMKKEIEQAIQDKIAIERAESMREITRLHLQEGNGIGPWDGEDGEGAVYDYQLVTTPIAPPTYQWPMVDGVPMF